MHRCRWHRLSSAITQTTDELDAVDVGGRRHRGRRWSCLVSCGPPEPNDESGGVALPATLSSCDPATHHPRLIVSPFLFNRKTKSDLGWAFIGLIDGGRIKEYADDGADITRIYRHQLAACTYEVLPGPGKLLRWSAPVSRGHDDLLISIALRERFDMIDWRDRTARGSTRM